MRKAHRGDLEDLESLRSGAAESDGVIHTAFIHDFSKFKENCEIDRRAIEALGEALAGSKRPLIVTAGLYPTPGRPTTEDDAAACQLTLAPRFGRGGNGAWYREGVRASVMRLPQVHDRDKAGLVTYLIAHGPGEGSLRLCG